MDRHIMIDGHPITQDGDAWVVAEIGHNHGGSLNTAMEMCRVAKECGADAVKLQKRTNKRIYTKKFLQAPYNSIHAYGATYGEHRDALEFGWSEYYELQAFCIHIGITFFATAFDEEAADFLEDLGVPAYKIASGDLVNTPLIRHVAKKGRPIILSTGGADSIQMHVADKILDEAGTEGAFLHCVAMYPTPAEHANLSAIPTMMTNLTDRLIGYSCHYNGILMAEIAYLLGARIIEKHFTLDHAAKGSDHAMSLQPEGLRRLCRDLKRLRLAKGDGKKRRRPEEEAALSKMEKCLYPVRALKSGHIIEPGDLIARSPATPDGLRPYSLARAEGEETNIGVVKKALCCDASTESPITEDMLTSI